MIEYHRRAKKSKKKYLILLLIAIIAISGFYIYTYIDKNLPTTKNTQIIIKPIITKEITLITNDTSEIKVIKVINNPKKQLKILQLDEVMNGNN